MKKVLQSFLFLLMVCGTVALNAQLANNTVAPDFTLTDINGNEHNLYSYLDDGKSVILDFSATWCPPCWSYHTSGEFETLWEEHGPDGADDVMILMIEADLTTNSADLNGNTSATMGDWVTGTPYPIIDLTGADGAVSDAYNVSYFPTIYFVGPNRLIQETAQVPSSTFINLVESALPPASGQNNLAIANYTGETFYCESLNASLSFQNLGLDNLTSATFVATDADGNEVATKEWTGNVEPYGIGTVDFDPISIEGSVADLTFEATMPNGQSDEDPTANTTAIVIERPTTETEEITITIRTDDYGYETYWALINEAGDIVVDGGNSAVGLNGGGLQAQSPGGYGNNETITETVVVDANACYEFKIVDDWGDGICCAYGSGFYSIEGGDGATILEGGEFGANDDKGFRNSAAPLVAAFVTEVSDMTVSVTNQSSDNAESYLWNFGDGTPEAYSQEMTPAPYTYSEAGTYTVSLTVSNSSGEATYTEEVMASWPVSVNEIEGLTGINVFPVPASNEVNIAYDLEAAKTLNVTIVNALGQTVKQLSEVATLGSNQITVNTTDFANGVYFVNFESNGQISSQRFTVLK